MFLFKKKIFNFKLGTTSYIIPYKKNNITRNVEYVSKYCDIVQLLFFSKDYLTEVMEEKVIDKLLKIKQINNLEYVIHLPIDLNLMDDSEDEQNNIRKNGFAIVEKIIINTKILKIRNYILHLDRFENFNYPKILKNDKNQNIFEENLKLFKILEKKYDIKILIENTSYDLIYYSDLINKYDFNICLDFGHLFLYNFSIVDFLKEFNNRILLVHIHGVSDNKDHMDLSINKFENNQFILNFLKCFNFDVIIEVFKKKDFFKSLNYIYSNLDN